MSLKTIIAIIILAYILDFFIKKYVKLSMVFTTIIIVALIIIIDSYLFMAIFISEVSVKLSISLKLVIIIILILPFIFIKEYMSHTIRILDFCINKNKLLKMGHIEKGIIQEIKCYGFAIFRKDGYYLIVDFNGEKIKSLPFKFHQRGRIVKTTHETIYYDNKFNKENLDDLRQSYNVGDEIDLIIYKNKKYVKLK